MSCGISTSFPVLFPTRRQITHALLTRSPLYLGSYPPFRARLACVRHAASVDSEPGSNSPVKLVGCLRTRFVTEDTSGPRLKPRFGMCCALPSFQRATRFQGTRPEYRSRPTPVKGRLAFILCGRHEQGGNERLRHPTERPRKRRIYRTLRSLSSWTTSGGAPSRNASV